MKKILSILLFVLLLALNVNAQWYSVQLIPTDADTSHIHKGMGKLYLTKDTKNLYVGKGTYFKQIVVDGTSIADGQFDKIVVQDSITNHGTSLFKDDVTMNTNCYLSNNKAYYIKDNVGTDRNMVYVDASNNQYFGNGNMLNLEFQAGASSDIKFRNNVTDRLYIKGTNGNIGIGTIVPGALLTVNSKSDTLVQIFGDKDGTLWSSADSVGFLILPDGSAEFSQTVDHASTISIGTNGGTSGGIDFVASDNDQGDIDITTSDELAFTNFSGGYTFDNEIDLYGTIATGLNMGFTITGNGIDFSSSTIDHTGSNGPCLIRGGTYASPIVNADEDQSGMIRLYGTTSADGSSYDRGIFQCLTTTGTKGVFPIAGLAEVRAQSGVGPAQTGGGQFIANINSATGKVATRVAAGWASFYGAWCKVASNPGSEASSGSVVAPLWVDNQMNGTVNGEEYGIFSTTGTETDAFVGFESTAGLGHDQLFYWDNTTYNIDPISNTSIKVKLNTTQYYIPLSTTNDAFTWGYPIAAGAWGYTGEHIVLPEASSNTNAGLGIYSMVDYSATAGKVFAGSYSRALVMTTNQTNQSTIVGSESQFRLRDVDIADGVHAGLWAYAEQSGTSVLSGGGTFDAISATVESGSGFTAGATEHVTGLTLDSSINGSASIDPSTNFSALYIKSNGKDWYYGTKYTGIATAEILGTQGETWENITTDGVWTTDGGITTTGNVDVTGDVILGGITKLKSVSVDLTPSQINALEATPIQLVAAGGANTIIEFVSAMLIWNYVDTDFTVTNADNKFRIQYDASTDVSEAIDMNTFLEGSADAIRWCLPAATSDTDLLAVVNKKLELFNEGTGDVTGGTNSTLTVKVTYRVHNTGL